MPVFAAGFVSGNLALQWLPALPGWQFFLLAPLLFLLFAKGAIPRFVAATVAGFLWVLLVAGWHKEDILPAGFEGVELEAVVRVISIPVHRGRSVRFQARIEDAYGQALPRRVRLSFYPAGDKDSYTAFRPGDLLVASLRLKRPHGYMNPGGFDYEKYLFSQRIGASGYFRDFRLVGRAHERSPQVLRYRLYQRLRTQATPGIGAIIALVLGERGLMQAKDRKLLIETGTGHLFAISGLHITLVFGFVFLVFRFLWTRSLLHLSLWPSFLVAMVPAFLAASAYGWLAGFTIPTQRALVMLGCVVACSLLRRRLSPGASLAPAIVAVIACDPLGTLTVSFWLSFIAVGFIVLYLGLHPWREGLVWLRLQPALALALLPAGLWFFGQGALIAPLANLVAVPLVSLLVLPGALLAVLLVPFETPAAAFFLDFADFFLGLMWQSGAWVSQFEFLQWRHSPPAWSYLFACPGIAAIVLASRWRYKLAAAVLLLPLCASASDDLPQGAFKVAFLDVGQGLSVLVTTRGHSLLFDTGPAYGENFSTAERVIIPYLQSRHVDRLDVLLVSHEDNDHAGGIKVIDDRFTPRVSLGNAGVRRLHEGFETCYSGKAWTWDGVSFEIVHPPAGGSRLVGNDTSCVLRVTAGEHSLLLTGDIEEPAERLLLARGARKLRAAVVLVPHHGSLSSSIDAFVAAVSPKIAVVASGWRNRFALPRPEVLARYLDACARVFNTARTGTLVLSLVPEHKPEVSYLHRRDARRFWHTERGSYSMKRC